MKRVFLICLTALIVSCGGAPKERPKLIDKDNFDWVVNSREVGIFTIVNRSGMAAQFTDYGARMVSLWAKGADGSYRDIIAGFDNIDGYIEEGDLYNGPIIGRYAGVIAEGRFELDGKQYELSKNSGENHLNGGIKGLSSRVWEVVQLEDAVITFGYISPKGEEGYPGNMSIYVTYSMEREDELHIRYRVTADAPTVLNLTSSAYFNLHGNYNKEITSHILEIDADRYISVDGALLPTGEIASVEGTPMDFRRPTAIGERIDSDFDQLTYGAGYDHNWALNSYSEGVMREVAELYEPSTGIVMTIETDQPGLRLYSGNHLSGRDSLKFGAVNGYRTGVVLSTQFFPDSPNHSNFPSTLLTPEEIYRHDTVLHFSTRKEE